VNGLPQARPVVMLKFVSGEPVMAGEPIIVMDQIRCAQDTKPPHQPRQKSATARTPRPVARLTNQIVVKNLVIQSTIVPASRH